MNWSGSLWIGVRLLVHFDKIMLFQSCVDWSGLFLLILVPARLSPLMAHWTRLVWTCLERFKAAINCCNPLGTGLDWSCCTFTCQAL